MRIKGICHKMDNELLLQENSSSSQIIADADYHLRLDPDRVHLNPWIGHKIRIEWTGVIHCISCAKPTTKSYSQGHCFRCFKTKASCDLCMMKPETCHFHLNTCREPDFAAQVCFQPHYVYLANSSALKVGITRQPNVPYRWIDQGASQALPIFEVNSRRLSGFVETLFASQLADKTDWRKLLKSDAEPIDLKSLRDQILLRFEDQLEQLITTQNELFPDHPPVIKALDDAALYQINYPVTQYLKKITSLNLDKLLKIEGQILGIKGQYLILDIGVINLRKYSGYELIIDLD